MAYGIVQGSAGTRHKESPMTKLTTWNQEGFHAVLAATGRSPEIPESADAYGWLSGSWDLEVLRYLGVDIASRNIRAEAHFRWILEGRAMQDIWIMPSRNERSPVLDKK